MTSFHSYSMKPAKAAAFLFVSMFLLLAAHVQAKSVALTGLMGSKAMVVVDGTAPKLMKEGQTHRGVKLLSIDRKQQAVHVRVDNEKLTLRVGGMPVNVSATSVRKGGNTLVLPQSHNGHYVTDGFINGKNVKFMVDTGATVIAMGESTARKIGLDYQKGQRTVIRTANGPAAAWAVKLDNVRIKDVTVSGVDAVVGRSMPYVLLGNSFLTRFNMQTTNDTLVLTKKY